VRERERECVREREREKLPGWVASSRSGCETGRISSVPKTVECLQFKRSDVGFTEMCSGSEAGSYLRRIDFCITLL